MFSLCIFLVWVNTSKLMSGFTESVNDLKEVNKRAVHVLTSKHRNGGYFFLQSGLSYC